MSDFFGSIVDAVAGIQQQDWASDEADAARQAAKDNMLQGEDWAAKMRASTYQTTVQDMKAAGLNPMLAYSHGGTPTPGAPAATGGIAASSSGTRLQPAEAQAAWSAAQLNAAAAEAKTAEASKTRAEEQEITARTKTYPVTIDNIQQQIKESQARAENLVQQTHTGAATAENVQQQTENLRATLPQIRATVNMLQTLATKNKADAILAGAQTTVSDAQYDEIQQRVRANLPAIQAALQKLETQHRNLELPQAGMRAAVYDSPIGALSEFLRALNPLTGIISVTK